MNHLHANSMRSAMQAMRSTVRSKLTKKRGILGAMRAISVIMLMAGFVPQSAMGEGVAKFDTKSHNFGKFFVDEVQTWTFTFTNTGDDPIIIQRVASTCGCTVTEFTHEAIKPGEKGEVSISYNGTGKAPGRFRRVITMYSDASEPKIKLSFEGVMQYRDKEDSEK